MQDEKNLKHVLAGVIFEGFGDNKSSISDDIKLTFRFHADPINNNRSLNDRFGVMYVKICSCKFAFKTNNLKNKCIYQQNKLQLQAIQTYICNFENLSKLLC